MLSFTIQALEKGLVEIRGKGGPGSAGLPDINLSFPLPLTSGPGGGFQVFAQLSKDHSKNAQTGRLFTAWRYRQRQNRNLSRALEETVKQGERGIVLVPEIAMTPQIIERFVSRFPGRVAVLHSEFHWENNSMNGGRIKNGEFDVVIGPRSAVFAPQPDLGLIILDEEHEWTYKQQDDSPRYHTREAALKLAELSRSHVVLGSATPDVESYFRALKVNTIYWN